MGSIVLILAMLLTDVKIEREPDLYVAPRISVSTWADIEAAIEQAAIETDLRLEIKTDFKKLGRLPDLFQLQLDELKYIHGLEIDSAKAGEQSDCRVENLATNLECAEIVFYPWGKLVPVIVAVLLLVGGGAGYGIARLF